LKGATDLSAIQSTLASDKTSLDAVKKDIVLNSPIKTILFSARDDDFRITSYQADKFDTNAAQMGRDQDWKEMAEQADLVGVSCTHLGGDETVSWTIEVDKCGRGDTSVVTEGVKANGNDIFVCNHWLLRSIPRQQPSQSPADVFSIIVTYLWQGFSKRGRIEHNLGTRILELGGDQCARDEEYVLWLREQPSE